MRLRTAKSHPGTHTEMAVCEDGSISKWLVPVELCFKWYVWTYLGPMQPRL